MPRASNLKAEEKYKQKRVEGVEELEEAVAFVSPQTLYHLCHDIPIKNVRGTDPKNLFSRPDLYRVAARIVRDYDSLVAKFESERKERLVLQQQLMQLQGGGAHAVVPVAFPSTGFQGQVYTQSLNGVQGVQWTGYPQAQNNQYQWRC